MFVDRARVIGSGPGHIMRRHILPNVTNLIVANTVLTFAAAIFTETTLAFIGLGDPFAPSWGQLLNAAQSAGAPEPRGVVVHRPAGGLRRPGHPGLHPGRQRARRRHEPEVGGPPMMRMPTGPDETGKVMEDVELEAAERDAEIELPASWPTTTAGRRSSTRRRSTTQAIEAAAAGRRRSGAGASGRCRSRPTRPRRSSQSRTCGRTSSSSPAGSRPSTASASGSTTARRSAWPGSPGCGKTTTALSLVRLLPANARIRKGSSIELFGIDLVPKTENQLRRYRWREISIVFQGAMNALNPVHRIGEQIGEPIEVRLGLSRDCRAQAGGRAPRARRDPAPTGRRLSRTSCRAGCASGR